MTRAAARAAMTAGDHVWVREPLVFPRGGSLGVIPVVGVGEGLAVVFHPDVAVDGTDGSAREKEAEHLHDEPVELEIKVRALHAPGPGVLHDLCVVAGVDHVPDHKRRVAQCAAAQEDVLVVERDVLLLSLVLHRPTEALEIGVREFKGDVALEVLDGFHEVVFLDLFEDVGLGGLSLQIGSLSRSAVSR